MRKREIEDKRSKRNAEQQQRERRGQKREREKQRKINASYSVTTNMIRKCLLGHFLSEYNLISIMHYTAVPGVAIFSWKTKRRCTNSFILRCHNEKFLQYIRHAPPQATFKVKIEGRTALYNTINTNPASPSGRTFSSAWILCSLNCKTWHYVTSCKEHSTWPTASQMIMTTV